MAPNSQDDLIQRCSFALQRAAEFLVNKTLPNGGWADFQTNRSGVSTSWVTGHVLWNIGKILPREIVDNSVTSLILGRHTTGGWGYSEKTPPDCDSTLHVLNAFHTIGILDNIPNVQKSFEFINSHQTSDGGFSTYGNGPELASYRGNGTDRNYEGWAQSHVCVTAVALQALPLYQSKMEPSRIDRMIDFIIKRQSQNGYWDSYWWRSKVFATSRILIGLRSCKIVRNVNGAIQRGFEWLRQVIDGSGFCSNGYDRGTACPLSTALYVKALVSSQNSETMPLNTLLWLVSKQNLDGSWSGEPVLQIPPPDLLNPSAQFPWKIGGQGVGSCSTDNNRIYTTAAVAGAINDFLLFIRRNT